MKKFGFKKDKDLDDDNRSALFGNRKKTDTPPKDNPYAAPQSGGDRYSNPPPYQGGSARDQYRQDKSPAYTSSGGAYGGSGGYGSQAPYGSGRPSERQGGYGGLGRTNSQDTASTDAGRDQLFGGAAQRYQQRQDQGGYQAGGQTGAYGSSGAGGASGAYGDSGAGGGYGAYGDRQLTAEEQEEEDILASKQEIKFIKQQDVSSTRNALRLAQQAEETGRDTLARLGAQGERIHNTERNLDLASSQNRIAEEKARELKTLNKSMFAMHVSNPFTSASRREERDRQVMENHRTEREQRDATRKAAWETQARGQAFEKDIKGAGKAGGGRSTLAERSKYQFEADSEDEEMENEIDANLDALHGAAKRLNHLGRAMGQEVDQQNKHIERITGKTDKVDDQIAMNRARLDRIK